MNNSDHLLPETRMAPVFMILALAVCILWAATIGFWSVIPFAVILIFSFWKRSVTISGMKNAEQFADSIERTRLELRHLNSKIGFITAFQYGTWIFVWIILREKP